MTRARVPDIGAQALAMVVASLGEEQFEHAYQCWLKRWNPHEAYSPDIEVNMVHLMSEAAEKVYQALTNAGADVLSRHGSRSLDFGWIPAGVLTSDNHYSGSLNEIRRRFLASKAGL